MIVFIYSTIFTNHRLRFNLNPDYFSLVHKSTICLLYVSAGGEETIVKSSDLLGVIHIVHTNLKHAISIKL